MHEWLLLLAATQHVEVTGNGNYGPEAAPFTKGRIADLRCALHRGPLCGRSANSLRLRQSRLSRNLAGQKRSFVAILR